MEIQSTVKFYVAPNGDDHWSGKCPVPNETKTDGPFATIEHARDALRLIKKQDYCRYEILFLGGVYPLKSTFVLTEQDSGSEKVEIVYRAYNKEKPVFTSEIAITGFKKFEGSHKDIPAEISKHLYVADLPRELGRIYSLYDEEGLLSCARGPIFYSEPMLESQKDVITHYNPVAGLKEEEQECYKFYFPKGLVKNWSNLEDIEVYTRSHPWTMNLLPLRMVDEERQIGYTALPATYPMSIHKKEIAIENTLEVITKPGDWVVNTRERKIYLWPRTEQPIGIKAPCLRELFRIEGSNDRYGSSDHPVMMIRFEGLTFRCADRDEWKLDDESIQHDWVMADKPDALLRFRGAKRCTVDHCMFLNSGGNAIRFDLYAQECNVQNTLIKHMGQCGIVFAGYGPGKKDVNKYNRIFNNEISQCGEIMTHSHGIILHQSGGNQINHNLIHNMPRKGICITGVRLCTYNYDMRFLREHGRSIRWFEIDKVPETWSECIQYSHSKDNLVEYNELKDLCKLMGDGAALNVSGAGEGNVIRYNYIHDIHASEQISGCIRTDNDQTGTLIYGNVLARANTRGFTLKRNNQFINNIIYDVNQEAYASLVYDEQIGAFGNATIEKNIFLDPGNTATFYNRKYLIPSLAGVHINNNIYFHCMRENETETNENDEYLYQLRQFGHDTESLYQDPVLVDPSNGDFRLSKESPAHKLLIESLDIRKMGLISRVS